MSTLVVFLAVQGIHGKPHPNKRAMPPALFALLSIHYVFRFKLLGGKHDSLLTTIDRNHIHEVLVSRSVFNNSSSNTLAVYRHPLTWFGSESALSPLLELNSQSLKIELF